MRALILLVERAQAADEHEPDGNRSGPIVLIHGFSASQVIWSRLLPTLQAEHPTLAVTLDGHTGGRPIASEKVSVAALADGVERDMDAAGFETATIVGNSLGGWLALELARRRRASSVVAIAPGGSWEPGSDADEHLRAHLVERQVGQAAAFAPPIRRPLAAPAPLGVRGHGCPRRAHRPEHGRGDVARISPLLDPRRADRGDVRPWSRT